ncbi:MAG TPA: hypothetical protein VM577_19630 [Anaerovoracaceae bacterium]|nr:hypothetical protein [Anaerovoracaceae bacterium]
MRRIRFRRILLLVLILALGLVAIYFTTHKNDTKIVFNACVISKDDKRLLVYKEDNTTTDRLCYVSIEKASLLGPNKQSISIDSIELGQMIKVTAGGFVRAIAPPTYETVYAVDILNGKNSILYEEGVKASNWHLGGTS